MCMYLLQSIRYCLVCNVVDFLYAQYHSTMIQSIWHQHASTMIFPVLNDSGNNQRSLPTGGHTLQKVPNHVKVCLPKNWSQETMR